MREEIGFEIVDFRKFDSFVTLTLTFDDLQTYIVRFVSLGRLKKEMTYIRRSDVIITNPNNASLMFHPQKHLLNATYHVSLCNLYIKQSLSTVFSKFPD